MDNIWIVEYSASQDCFHIDTLDRIASMNRGSMRNGKVPSYVPVGFADNAESASAIAAACREAFERREEMRVV